MKATQALSQTKEALAISRHAEQSALSQASHDSLTGLANRDLFDARLAQAMSMAKRHDWTLAVMFLDLDRFKPINDRHGHAAGDAVLKEVAARLARHARDEDTVSRAGGDEFLVLLVNPQGPENILRIAEAVGQRISAPIVWNGLQLDVNVSIGVAVYPADAVDGASLIRMADAAMYDVKKTRAACERTGSPDLEIS